MKNLFSPVLAHVLETDGSIGAVMHIDPDDDPIVATPSYFFFEFKDTKGRFDLKNCNCKVSILKDKNQIYSSSLSNPTFTYVFPERNVYQIKVEGKAINNSFQDFKLIYTVRVERQNVIPNQNISFVSLFVVLFFVIITLFLLFKRKNEKNT